jgi:hypothetical protein
MVRNQTWQLNWKYNIENLNFPGSIVLHVRILFAAVANFIILINSFWKIAMDKDCK